jgi:hypothetical protein
MAHRAIGCLEWATVKRLEIRKWPLSLLIDLPHDQMRSIERVVYVHNRTMQVSHSLIERVREAFEALSSSPEFVERGEAPAVYG